MQMYFVIALIFATLVAIFAVQNSTPVHIKFLFWEIPRISQVLVILGAAIVGALAALFISISKQVRLLWQVRQLSQENTRLKNECRRLKQNINSGFDELKESSQEKETDETR